MVSYSARLPNLEYNAGRDLESDISTLLREALSCQSKSAAVYFLQAVFRRGSHQQLLPPTWQPLPLFPLPRNKLPVSYHLFLCVNSNRQQHNCHHKQHQSFHTIYYLVETYKSNCYSDTKVAGIIYYIGIQITDYITRITDRCPRREIKNPVKSRFYGICHTLNPFCLWSSAERQALELILSENITKSQFTDNQISIKV